MALRVVEVAAKKTAEKKEFTGIASLMTAAKWLKFGKIADEKGKPIIGQENVYNFLAKSSKDDQVEAIALANKSMTEWFAKKSSAPKQTRRGW